MKESVIHYQPGPAESGKEKQALCDIFQPRGVAVSSASSLLFPFGSPNTMGVEALCYVSMAGVALVNRNARRQVITSAGLVATGWLSDEPNWFSLVILQKSVR